MDTKKVQDAIGAVCEMVCDFDTNIYDDLKMQKYVDEIVTEDYPIKTDEEKRKFLDLMVEDMQSGDPIFCAMDVEFMGNKFGFKVTVRVVIDIE